MTDADVGKISRELLAELSGHGNLRRYAAGEVLITEGEVSDALYVLVAGQLKVYTSDAKGRELNYNILQPGEFFGEMFLDGGPRSASVKAIVASQCVVVDQVAFRGFMAAYPEFAERLVTTLIGRLRHATLQIKGLALDGVYERLAAELTQVPPDAHGVRMLPVELTQREIAARVGATREMVNHLMRKLIRDGYLVKHENGRFVVMQALPKHFPAGA